MSGAEAGNAQEIRYAPVWDSEKEKIPRDKIRVIAIFWFVFLLTWLSFSYVILWYYSFNWLAWGFLSLEIICSILFFNMANSTTKDVIQYYNNLEIFRGWHREYNDASYKHIKTVSWNGSALMLLLILTTYFQGSFIFGHIIGGLSIIIMLCIPVVIRLFPQKVSRTFDMSFDTANKILTRSCSTILPNGTWVDGKWPFKPMLRDGKIKITFSRARRAKVLVRVITPHNQLLLNRELRDKVTAILEGREPETH